MTGKVLKFAQNLLKGMPQIEAWKKSGHNADRRNAYAGANNPKVVTWLAEQRARQERREAARPAPPPPAPPPPGEPEHITMARELYKVAKANHDSRGMLAAMRMLAPPPAPKAAKAASSGSRAAPATPSEVDDDDDIGRPIPGRTFSPWHPARGHPTDRELQDIRREFQKPRGVDYGPEHAEAIWNQRRSVEESAAWNLCRAKEIRHRLLTEDWPWEKDDEDRAFCGWLAKMNDAELLEWQLTPPPMELVEAWLDQMEQGGAKPVMAPHQRERLQLLVAKAIEDAK